MLENSYYKIIGRSGEGLDAVFRVALLPDCEVYKGHFPGNPVSPGVCNIETITECAMLLTGKRVLIDTIRKGFAVTAKIADNERTYMEYKGEMTVITA